MLELGWFNHDISRFMRWNFESLEFEFNTQILRNFKHMIFFGEKKEGSDWTFK